MNGNYRSFFKMRTSLVLILLAGSLMGCAETMRENIDKLFMEGKKQSRAMPASVYCYKTIGKVNCYSQPLQGQEANRLIGYDGKSPRSTAATGPLRP